LRVSLIHFLGIKPAALFGNIVTVGKLLPLLIFVAVGLMHMEPLRFSQSGPPIVGHFAQAVLMIAWLLVSSSWIESRDVTILILLGGLVYAVGKRRAKLVEPAS
jgi:amino acid transporter